MWIVKQMDFILVLFFIFMILIISGLINPFTDFNQLLSYTCFHSIGISFVTSEIQLRRVIIHIISLKQLLHKGFPSHRNCFKSYNQSLNKLF